MKLFIFALAVSAVCAISLDGGETYKPSCQKKVYCDSKLLHYVQMARIFPDSKSFVDLHMKFDEDTVMRAFNDLLKDTKNEPSKAELQEFVDYFFDSESGLETWTPTDFKSEPAFLSTIKDPQLKQFAKNVNNIWPTLGRKMKPMVFENPESFSMIPVHNGFVVPGGRFREFYYWDTYWIIEGLLISGMTETVKGMLSNFIELQRQFGHIPNGARWYYQERSQPPLLSAMMAIYLQETNDVEFLRANIDVLESELEYWLHTHSVVFKVAGKEYSLLRYYAPSVGPRPESYYEDYTTAQSFETEQRQKQFYTDIKSAAESGWDFSSRWFISKDGGNKGNLTSIHTTDIVPVDLNAIYANAVQYMAHFYSVLRDNRKGAHWLQISKKWMNTINDVFWDEEDGIWYDWDLHNSKHRKFYYPSNIAPLWMGVVEPEFVRAKSQKILSYMKKTHSLEYPGGVPTSLIRSGEQWDFPNAWPPLVSMVVGALEALQTEESRKLAFEVAQTWVRSNYKGYLSNKHLYEKYDVESPGKVGSGGEYTTQDGFGWTNGAVLEMLAKYGTTMTAVHGYVPFHSAFPQYSSGAVSYTQSFNSPNVGVQPVHITPPKPTAFNQHYFNSFPSQPKAPVKPVYFTSDSAKPTVFTQSTYLPSYPTKPLYVSEPKPENVASATVKPVFPETKPQLVSSVKPQVPETKPEYVETKPVFVSSVKPQFPETKPEYVQTKPEFVSTVKPQLPETKPEYVEAKPVFVSSTKPQLLETKPEYVETKPVFVSSVKPQSPETKPEYVQTKPEFVSSVKPQLPETKPEYVEAKPVFVSLVKPENKPQFDETKPEYVETKPEYVETKPEYVETKPEYVEAKPAFISSVKPQLPETKPEFVQNKPNAFVKPEYTPSYEKPEYIESPKPTVAFVPFKPEHVSSYPAKPLYDSPVESKPQYISSEKLDTPVKPVPVPLIKPESASIGYTKPSYIPSIPVKPFAEIKPEVDTPAYNKPSYAAPKPEFVSSTSYEAEYVPTTTAKPSKPLYVSAFETKPTYVVSVEGKPTLNKPGYGSFVQTKPEFVSSTTFVPEYVPTTTFKPEPETKPQYVATAPVKPEYLTITATKPYVPTYPAKPLFVSSAKPEFVTSAPVKPDLPVKPAYITLTETKPEYVQTKPEYVQTKPEYVQTKPEYVQTKPEYVQNKPEYVQTKPEFVSSVKPQLPETKPEYVQTKPEFVSLVKPETKPQFDETQPEYVETKPEYVETKPEYVETKPEYVETKPQYVETKPTYVVSVEAKPTLNKPGYGSFVQTKPEFVSSTTFAPEYVPTTTFKPEPETKPQYVATAPVKPAYLTITATKPYVPTYPAKPLFVSSAKPEFVTSAPVKPDSPVKPAYIILTETKPEYVQTKPEYVQTKPEYVQTKPEYVQTKPEYVQTKPEYVQTKPEYVQTKPEYVQTKPEYVQTKPEYVQTKPEYVQTKPEYVQTKPEYVQTKPEYVQTKPEYVQTKPEFVSTVKPQLPETKPEFVSLVKPETKPQFDETQPEYVETKPEYVETKPEYVETKPEYVETKPQYVETKPTYVVSVEAKPTLNKPGYGSFVQTKPEFVSSTTFVPEYVPTTTFKPEPETKPQYIANAPVKPAYITITATKPYVPTYPAKPLFVSSAKPEFVTSAPVKHDSPVKPAYITLTEAKPEYVAPSPAKPLYDSTDKPDLAAPVKPAYITLTSVQSKPDFAASTLKPEEKPTFEAHVKPEYVLTAQADSVPSAEPKPEYVSNTNAEPTVPTKEIYVQYTPTKPTFTSQSQYFQTSPTKPLATPAKPSFGFPIQIASASPQVSHSGSSYVQSSFVASTLSEYKPTTPYPASTEYESSSVTEAEYTTVAPAKVEYATQAPFKPEYTTTLLDSEYSSTAAPTEFYTTTQSEHSDSLTPVKTTQATPVKPGYFVSIQAKPQVNTLSINTASAEKPAYSTSVTHTEEDSKFTTTYATSAPTKFPSFTEVKPSILFSTLDKPEHTQVVVDSAAPQHAAILQQSYFTHQTPGFTSNKRPLGYLSNIPVQTFGIATAPPKTEGFSSISHFTVNSTSANPPFAFTHVKPEYAVGTSGSGFVFNKTVTPGHVSTVEFVGTPVKTEQSVFGYSTFGKPSYLQTGQYVPSNWHSSHVKPIFGTTSKNVHFTSTPIKHAFNSGQYQPQFNSGLHRNTYVQPTVIKSVSVSNPATVVA